MPQPEIISPALGALLDIMTSMEVEEARCVAAARAVIEFEAPAEVFDLTYKYLLGVATDERQEVGLKLEALKLIRKVEAKRVVPGTAAAVNVVAAKALGRRSAVAKRRVALMREGKWPPRDSGWMADAVGEPMAVEPEGLAERLKAARLGAA